ncbi:hypothetical protein [Flavivirga algicola]|uniref:DUF3352 domain-containing protein n=1 Tax=Flavivirga algicola TaxID=2729136 RepID=A0ABX1RXQ8_9FLAO|nr:hypothetical protein [Flavivirga algicola]NMH88367.1 hypothetical protein [Flavivirga algicola]
MKKKLAYLFVAIIIVVLVLYLFRYKRSLIVENKIPITATEIVHIDLRQIEHHLLVDAIKNPFKYISFKTEKKKERLSFNEAISVPRNLLFFTNTSSFKGAWFSNIIELKNNAKLRSYLLQEGFEESIDETLELYRKDKMILAVSGENLLIVYKKQKQIPVRTVIQSIFNETSFYKKDTDLLKSISNSKSDMAYTNLNADFLDANFKNGCFEIKGKLHSNLFIADAYAENPKHSIGFLSTRINKDHQVFKSLISDKNKTKFREFAKLSIDSIIDHWNGSAVINLKAVHKEIDTIVTYEYDDDFNKIEKKSVQELNIPHAVISLGSDAKLYEYFYRGKAIQIIDNDTLFAGMPLYKMYVRRHENNLNIFTQKQFESSFIKEKKYKLNTYIDISKYLDTPLEFSLMPNKKDYFQLLKDVSAKLTLSDELLIQVRLKENNRNFLSQFLKP